MDEAVIPLSRTSSSVTLQDFLSTFQEPTAAGLATVVTGLGEGVQDSGGELALALQRLAPAMGDAARLVEATRRLAHHAALESAAPVASGPHALAA